MADIDFNFIHGKFDLVNKGQGSTTVSQLTETVSCDTTVAVGDVVKSNGIKCLKAQANNFSNSNAVGIVQSKPSASTAVIIFSGLTDAIFVGLDADKDYFLSAATAGGLTNVPPSGDEQVVAVIGRPISSTRFMVNIGLRMEIDTD